MRLRPLPLAALVASLGFVPAVLQAGEAPAEPLETVDIWALVPRETAEIPGAASVLTAEEIERLRPYTLHDALRFVPGVRTLDDDALGRRAAIGIRGSASRRSRNVLLLEDGVPINASTYLDASTHYTPPTERLERVEVLKANGQVMLGPLNNHGIVNFRNKRPTVAPETTGEFSLGNLGTSRQHLMHRRTDGRVGTVFSWTRFAADGLFDVEATRFNDLYAATEVQLTPQQTLSASATYLRERSNYDESNLTPQEFALAPATKQGRFGQEFNSIAVDYLKADLRHEWRAAGGTTVATRLFATDLDRPRYTVDPGEYEVGALPALVLDDGDGSFVPGAGGNGSMISRDRHYRGFGYETRVGSPAWVRGGTTHRLQGGVRLERQLFLDRRTAGETGEILTESRRGRVTRDEKYQATAGSAFVEDRIQRGAWTFVPGLRAERYTQSRQRVFPTHNPAEREDRSVLLPGLSVLYAASADTEFFGSLQRGYTPAIARGSEFPLRPEIGVNSQVGIRWRRPHVSGEAALFHNRLHDTLVQLPFIDPQTFASVVVNESDARTTGIDFGLRVDSAGDSGAPLNLFAVVAWAYVDARFTGGLSDGNRLPEVPRNSGSVTLGLEHRGGFELSATLTHDDRFFTDPANNRALLLANEDGEPLGAGDVIDLREPIVLGAVPSRTLLSARASYALRDGRTRLWVQGRNLTDRVFLADVQNGLRPGAPRTVMAGVTLQLR
jgi:Fe(3+) dicitrate transport protein